MFIAPVSMGDNSYTAAGSIITRDVPDNSLAIARVRQTNIGEWNSRKRIPNGAENDGGEN
jgi:bifunctional UDP-N-acetylglucosamine pyrophosphorylase/glucosamine-1-phosphate N-acetyltransferase